jgi:tetratricopeptide (TPR) repeat protein
VPAETPRIVELRRRVQSDPSSIAFAQLAEEYRRAGNYEEAIDCCRTGLSRHPGYLSARVTLGRALMETGGLEEAAREFELVLRSAPDNLAAIRGMAEIHQRDRALEPALDYYKRALSLAQHDPELAETVGQIARELDATKRAGGGAVAADAHSEPVPAAARTSGSPADTSGLAREGSPATSTPPLVDFDALLQSLGAPDATPPPLMASLLNDEVIPAAPSQSVPEHSSDPESDFDNPFAALERALRAFDDTRSSAPAPPPSPTIAAPSAPGVLEELEAWLDAIVANRAGRSQSGSPWQIDAGPGGDRR